MSPVGGANLWKKCPVEPFSKRFAKCPPRFGFFYVLNRYPGVGGSKSSVNPGTRKYTISGGPKNVFYPLLGVDIILGGGVGGG